MAAFAKYDGIDGEATDAAHDKWIEVRSLDWGAHRPESGGSGRRRGTAEVEDLVLSLPYDKAAPKLLEKCLTGGVIPRLDVELTATYGGLRVTYLRYELKNVMVTSYQVHASGDDSASPPMVVVANNFEEIEVTYTEYDETGSSRGNVETEHRVARGV
jgi:type VI secretion system secreted protein Hcp